MPARRRRGARAPLELAARSTRSTASGASIEMTDAGRGAGRARGPARPDTACRSSLYRDAWHEGVIGLVARRVSRSAIRPVVALARSVGRRIACCAARDARSPACTCATCSTWSSKRHPGLILRFGGHAMAAGLTLQRAAARRASPLRSRPRSGLRRSEAAFDQPLIPTVALAPTRSTFAGRANSSARSGARAFRAAVVQRRRAGPLASDGRRTAPAGRAARAGASRCPGSRSDAPDRCPRSRGSLIA